MENITTKNMSKLVREAYKNSLFEKNDDPSKKIKVEGIKRLEYEFNSESLEQHREIITAIIAQLPEKFKEGYSFNAMRRNKNDKHWTEDYDTCEILAAMAIGLNLMFYTFSREVWRDLPGTVPYLTTK